MFFNRDFVGGLLDVVSLKRFWFVETDQEFFCLFSHQNGGFGTLSCPPPSPTPTTPPLSLSQALVVLIMYCFYRRHNADVENM